MKLDNYNFKIDPKLPSREDSAKHQDFDALLASFESTPTAAPATPRMRWLPYLGGAIAAGIAAFLIFNVVTQPDAQAIESAYFAEQPFINPPLDDIKPQFVRHSLNASNGGTYDLGEGSRLIVPPSAFVDANGAAIEGDVEVRYRKYHDYVDFFLAGIPMEYDSAGTKYLLESAGMVEIYAEQDGQRINMAPGKSFDVELISEVQVPASQRGQLPKFNVYKLDTVQRNWIYKGVDDISILEDGLQNASPDDPVAMAFQKELEEIDQLKAEKLREIEATIAKPSAPLRPEKADGNKPVFNLDIKDHQIVGNTGANVDALQRELNNTAVELREMNRRYNNTLWQIDPAKNPDLNTDAAGGINWDDMTLRPVNNRDFELTLIKGTNRMKLIVNPVLSGADYTAALNDFNQRYNAYQQQIADREAQLADKKEQLNRMIEQRKAAAEQTYVERQQELRNSGMANVATEEMITHKVINRFAVNSLGIWNCDRPLPPYLAKVNAEFTDQKENFYDQNTAYLVNKSQNTVSRFYTGKKEIVFNKTSDNLMWLVTEDNRLAVYRPEKFKHINADKDDVTFVLEVVDKPIQSEADVRRILEF